jgi:hypothetical protein
MLSKEEVSIMEDKKVSFALIPPVNDAGFLAHNVKD